MRRASGTDRYFPYSIQISRAGWALIDAAGAAGAGRNDEPFIVLARRVARALQESLPPGTGPVRGGDLNLYALLNRAIRHVIGRYLAQQQPDALRHASAAAGVPVETPPFDAQVTAFARHYPARDAAAAPIPAPAALLDPDRLVAEALLLRLTGDNPALVPFSPLHDDRELAAVVPSRELAAGVERYLETQPPVAPTRLSLPAFLRAPVKASPHSLAGQIEYLRAHWGELLPPELLAELVVALDIVRVEEREFAGGPGKPQVLEFLKGGRLGREGYDYPEYERFSPDADWMAHVVMIAKMTYVWLDQLAKRYGRPVERLDQVPDEELDCLARRGFSALWLIGVWERSPASQRIKHLGGNHEAIASAYSLHDYTVARDLGGEEALENLRERCRQRGIRLASDMVPNHTGIFSRWTVEHPDWFVQLDYPPYPAYSYTGPDLSFSPEVTIQIEDGYWDRRDAAVVFRHYDHRNGRTRYIYHGNDGTSTPWNDTAQLNYLLPEVRETVIRTILHVARQFPIIRFDAAMTLAKKHYQRLWYPQPGHGSGVPSRAEHGMSREEFDRAFPEEFWREVVDRVAAEAPGTLLLAEAFWLMEGYFVRTLGMHRVYNSAFMNMLKMEENAKYRQTVKNVLEFDPEILKRFVNFMNNPDERTAVEQFGREGKYFGACVLLATMPGLPMFGHGQIEGFHEKYGMEFRRAAWDEPVDEHLVSLHERLIFPLLRRRWLFSGSQDFVFYDVFAGGHVNEDVFAYSNRAGSERGVVIFHNRFASTAGWVRTSTARAVKGEGGSRLAQTTLGAALGLDAGDGVWYAFRDYASGLEYLRSGRELCEQGLFVELQAYQYYAFLDFRELCDADGSWAELARQLGGRPVASLDEEVKQVRFAPLLSRYRVVCRLLAERRRIFFDPAVPESFREETLALLGVELAGFLAVLGGAESAAGSEEGAVRLVCAAEALGGLLVQPLPGTEERTAEEAIAPFFREEWGGGLFAACLVLLGAGVVSLPPEPAWVTDFGLDRASIDLLRAAGVPTPSAPWSTEELAALVTVLLAGPGVLGGGPEPAGERRARLMAEPQVREFLLVHVSGGTEWFNRERWELLLLGLFLAEVVAAALEGAAGEELRAVLTAAHRRMGELVAAAASDGYRVTAVTGTPVAE